MSPRWRKNTRLVITTLYLKREKKRLSFESFFIHLYATSLSILSLYNIIYITYYIYIIFLRYININYYINIIFIQHHLVCIRKILLTKWGNPTNLKRLFPYACYRQTVTIFHPTLC